MRILLVGGQSDSLTIYRGPLIAALIERGHEVTTVAGGPDPKAIAKLRAWGADYEFVPLERTGLNPVRDLGTILALVRVMRRLRPAAVIAYQSKPVCYSMVAAWIAGVRTRVAMITGLGYAFADGEEAGRRLTRGLVTNVYRVALRAAHGVIFQNLENRELFQRLGLLPKRARTLRVFGSGVDLQSFAPAPLPGGGLKVLMIARLLRDKGVEQFVEAARAVRQVRPDATFTLLGPLDPNPTGVRLSEIQAWEAEGVIRYAGSADDVRPFIADAHIVALPTYYGEGVPRSLLEAMAMGRPIVTTDMPGCRDTVEPGVNGALTPPRDGAALAKALLEMAAAPDQLARMGEHGRRRAVSLFDARQVSAEIVDFVELLAAAPPAQAASTAAPPAVRASFQGEAT